jgi:peptidoglycan/xylan/chitin deacetylase (PgdA/CDA1 family)
MATPRPRSKAVPVLFCCISALLGASVAYVVHSAPPTAYALATRGALVARMIPEGTSPVMERQATALPVPSEQTQDLPAPPTHDATGERFKEGMIITGATPHRMVLFTFDDGPHWKHTPRLLDALDAAGVRAVFFITGDRLVGEGPRQDQQRALIADIASRGHTIGNHTYGHLQLPLLTEPEVRREISESERLIAEGLGARPWLLRLPGGARSPRIDRIVAEAGYTSMLWNLGTGDFQVDSAEGVYQTWKRVRERRERELGEKGGIVLLHDMHEWSVDAFWLIYEDLLRENCALLGQGEELFDVVDDPSLFFVPRADAGTSDLAPVAVPREDVLRDRQARLREETAQRCAATAN